MFREITPDPVLLSVFEHTLPTLLKASFCLTEDRKKPVNFDSFSRSLAFMFFLSHPNRVTNR